MKKILNEGNQIHNSIFSCGSGTGSGSDFLTSSGSGSTTLPSSDFFLEQFNADILKFKQINIRDTAEANHRYGTVRKS
jgi:hypothetical protein